MPTKPSSWKKVREVRRQENFVGRADQLKVFADNFTGDVPRYMVFAVTGEGGVGKSTLLLQYEVAARAHASETIVITCDDRHPSPVTAMGYIAAELEKYGFGRKDFGDRYKKYRELRQELESDAKVPRPLVNLLSMGVTDLAIKSLRKVPGAGMFFEYADERAAGEAFAQLINFGIDRWGNKDEVKLLREPESDLTPLFLGLLGDASAVRRVVLMFDVFERTADTLAPWLLNLFRFEYGEFNTNVTFVISGRDALEQHWTELAGDLCRVALEPFTLDETRQYLSNRGITDEPVVAQIHTDTDGLPVLVELLAATNPQPGIPLADISKDAVQRFLQWTPQEDRRRVALLAAVPRQFNKDIFSAALGADVGGLYNWLAAQSYIRTNTERGSFYHEKVRELMLRHLRSTTPSELAATHHRLANYYAYAQAQLGFTEKAAYDSETWRRLEEARVYHTISAEPDRDVAVAANAFLHAFRWRWRFAENIGQVCRQVGEETNLHAATDMAATLLATYHAYDRDDYPVVIEHLGMLDAAASLTPSARCVIFARRGDTYRLMGRNEQALADLDRAIALDEKYAWAIASRGETYRQMGQYEQALADFDRAIALDEKYAWAIASRGQTYRALSRFDDAIANLSRAIELEPDLAWAIRERGQTYRQMGQYEQALADFDRAIALDDKAAWVFAQRGITYREIDKYEQALADFDRAIALDDKAAWVFAQRGITYWEMEKYEQALADFDRAIALDDKVAWVFAERGITYREMGKYEQALADFDRAIALNDKAAWVFALRGITYRGMEKYEQALADFNRAIALDESNASMIASRGETYRLMRHYEQALADFDRAIALDEKDAWAIASRGQTYRALSRFDDAIANLSRAIDLKPDLDWAIRERGETYRQMGQYEQALADFDRAIALDEKDAWAIASRGQTYRQIGQYEQALADLDRAIALDDKVAWMLGERGGTYLFMGNYDRALADFEGAIALESDDGSLLGRALTYRAMGRLEAAAADLAAAIEAAQYSLAEKPDDWSNKLNLALYHLAAGDNIVADGMYQAVIDTGVVEHAARGALQDLDDYLYLFPGDDAARTMRARLQQYIEERRTDNE